MDEPVVISPSVENSCGSLEPFNYICPEFGSRTCGIKREAGVSPALSP